MNNPLLVSSILGNLNLSPIESFINYEYVEITSSDVLNDLTNLEEGLYYIKKIKKKIIFTFKFYCTGKKVKKITI